MINIIPQSEVRLLNTPLKKDEEHTLNFSSLENQTSYFLSRTIQSFTDFTYVRDNQTIVVDKPYDQIYTCNYLMYRNNGFNNKYFYSFVTKMEYVSENSTRIYFEIDSLQTWYFQLNMNNVFVEREHVSNDTIGLHTIPENLETGEYIIDNVIKKAGYGKDNICFILATTIYPLIHQVNSKWELDGGNAATCNVYNSNLSGVEYFWYTNTSNGITRLQNTIQAFSNSGEMEGIYMLFTCPDSCFEKVLENPNEGFWGSVKQKQGSYSNPWEDSYTDGIYKPTTLNGYTPHNKKLLTFPFCYILMNNGNGGSAIYQYELFKGSTSYCNFYIDSVICPGASIFLRPYKYKNASLNFNQMDGLALGKFPMCSWNSDAYINWLTQNSVNIQTGFIKDALGTAMSVAGKNVTGAIGNALDFITNAMELSHKREYMTPQASGNLNSGDVTYSMEETTFTCYQMSIKSEFAQIIDKYFDMFGYKVNNVKIPNITGRRYWNYVKTIDCNIEGDIPMTDLEIIRQMFNNGVTLWHDVTKMYDYSQSNTIVS